MTKRHRSSRPVGERGLIMPKTHQAICTVYHRGQEVGSRVIWAVGFWSRLRGLLGRLHLAAGEGCFLLPASSVHMMGMLFPIDVVFLDKENRVIKMAPHLSPWFGLAWARGARAVLELPVGTIQKYGIELGERLEVKGPI